MKKVFAIAVLCIVGLGICIWFLPGSDSNGELQKNEIKAYFRPTVYLDYHPDLNEVSEIKIGGTISMSYESVKSVYIFNQKQYIEQITDCLNSLKLAEVKDDELPNKSPDSFVQYYDNNGELVKNFIIYGTVFIKDVDCQKLYRIKYTNYDIVSQLENLKFE